MLLRAAREQRAQLLALTPVVDEGWRGCSDVRDRTKSTIVPFPQRAAEAAVAALGRIRRERERARTCVDQVMAFRA